MSTGVSTGVDTSEKQAYNDSPEVEAAAIQLEHGAVLDKEAKFSEYKADAVEAENAEHNMGVWEAVKEYPMASFWAFIMSFTIVSCLSSPVFHSQSTYSSPPTGNRS